MPSLPGYTRWIEAGGFAGVVNFRWQRGTDALPPHVAGHVGYAVVPARRGQGIATRALALILVEARAVGLAAVELTAEPANLPSVRVIEANGGAMVGLEDEPEALGGRRVARYRIAL
ncbi:MAG: GNAT family N-acetyltransferase [Acetobacteraceae bacterium]|nr:GNAT family N-acetyltransferase [Acetobacteraceae bacterium]